MIFLINPSSFFTKNERFINIGHERCRQRSQRGIDAVNAVLLTLSELKVIHVPWTWLILIGTAGTFFGSYFLAPTLDGTTPLAPPEIS